MNKHDMTLNVQFLPDTSLLGKEERETLSPLHLLSVGKHFQRVQRPLVARRPVVLHGRLHILQRVQDRKHVDDLTSLR